MSAYVTSDLHGNYSIWEQIKNIIKEDDTLYVLGDSADRGKDGWKMIKEALDMPNCIYLIGNHDYMLIQALENQYRDDIDLHFMNGGKKTEKDFYHDIDGADYLEKLKKCPYYTFYINDNGEKIYLSHSGCPYYYDISKENFVWDRYSYRQSLEDEEKEEGIDVSVFGHTPAAHIYEELSIYKDNEGNNIFTLECDNGDDNSKILWLYNRTKCAIDCWTHYSKKAILLNLDTWEYQTIKGE